MLVISLLSLLIAIPLSHSTPLPSSAMSSSALQGRHNSRQENTISPVQLTRVTSIALLFAARLSFNGFYINVLGSGLSLYSGLFHVSTVSLGIETFIFLIGAIILLPWLMGHRNNQSEQMNWSSSIPEYSMIIVFSTIGASFLISSSDLVSMYLAIELQSFAVYILAALYRGSESATAAGLKYFLLGALSSAFILLGSVLIYGYTGLTNLDAITSLMSATGQEGITRSVNTEVYLGLVIIFVGLLFKVASAPFHNWAPDVYDGVPTIVTTWLTIMPKLSIFILLLTLSCIVLPLPESHSFFSTRARSQALLMICSTLSLIVGTVVGLAQIRIKRLLAYSTISHVGFMLLALSISGRDSIDAFLFYLIQYSLTTLNVFLILLAFASSPMPTEKSYSNGGNTLTSQEKTRGSDIIFISSLAGQFRLNPILALSTIVCLFSMAGIPPLMGFFAKYGVLYTRIHNGYYFVSVVAILASVTSAAYYLRIVRVLYFDGLPKSDLARHNVSLTSSVSMAPSVQSYAIATLTFLIVFFVLDSGLLLNTTRFMALSIYGY